MNTFIVPVDFSAVSLNAVHFACNLAIAKNGSLVLLNTYQIPITYTEVPIVSVTVQELSEISQTRLEDLKTSLEHITSGSIKIYTESRLGDLVPEMEDLCDKIQPAAVVMGTTGHGQMHEIFVGGNTSAAMRKIGFPLIVVPPGAIFKKPKNMGLACDMEEVVKTMPSEKIHEIVRWFDSKLSVLNVKHVAGNLEADLNTESLMADTFLDDLKPSYEFLIGDDVREGIQAFAETHNLDWLIVIPKKHRDFSSILKTSISRQLAYQSHIPIVCLHC